MDESPKQLIGERRTPIPCSPGQPARYDYEYRRCGTCSIFLACEPLAGRRMVEITERRTRQDWARFLKAINDHYAEAEKITLVMNNLNMHTPGSFYETFPPEVAKALWDRFEFIYTPKHGSWLNIAEIELSVLYAQCLNRRIAHIEHIQREVTAWEEARNNKIVYVKWQFTTDDARVKLARLYPSFDDWHSTSCLSPAQMLSMSIPTTLANGTGPMR